MVRGEGGGKTHKTGVHPGTFGAETGPKWASHSITLRFSNGRNKTVSHWLRCPCTSRVCFVYLLLLCALVAHSNYKEEFSKITPFPHVSIVVVHWITALSASFVSHIVLPLGLGWSMFVRKAIKHRHDKHHSKSKWTILWITCICSTLAAVPPPSPPFHSRQAKTGHSRPTCISSESHSPKAPAEMAQIYFTLRLNAARNRPCFVVA